MLNFQSGRIWLSNVIREMYNEINQAFFYAFV